MHLGRHIGAWLLTLLAIESSAQEITPARSTPNPTVSAATTNRPPAPAVSAGVHPGRALTNVALEVIARVRGVPPAAVTLGPRSAAGPFEIDVRTAKDLRTEAIELSKALGSAAAVVFEQRSPEGGFKTNRIFRAGQETVTAAPADGPLKSGLRHRLYVWPENRVAPPPLKPRLIFSETTTNR